LKGSELTPWLIRYGYEQGAFPMTTHGDYIEWFQPKKRALFPIEGIHVSHSLRKTIRQGVFDIRFDSAFEEVMRGCLRPDDNWISEDIIRVYGQVHAEGWGHCCECWQGDVLAGGIYGIALGSCFCAESMFHRVTDASKVALWAMIERCRSLGFTLFDAQVMNPHLASLGAVEVSHAHYMGLLQQALKHSTPWSAKVSTASQTPYS
jgi:leucyl/phenylalanyl-tRNA---protein transferase